MSAREAYIAGRSGGSRPKQTSPSSRKETDSKKESNKLTMQVDKKENVHKLSEMKV